MTLGTTAGALARSSLGAILTGVQRTVTDRNYRRIVDRLHRESYRDGFVVKGIHYRPDPCSVGLTAGGEITGASAADLVRDRDLADLHVLDICSGVGLVGLTLLASLGGEARRRVRELTFVDINIFNINSIERTLETNPPERWGNVTVRPVLSDGLSHIDPAQQFDLIVSNPPHLFLPNFTDRALDPDVLGTNDAGWTFHHNFYAVAADYLSDRGEVWFLENHLAESDDDLVRMAKEAPGLELVDVFDDRRDRSLFWVMSKRERTAADDTPPLRSG